MKRFLPLVFMAFQCTYASAQTITFDDIATTSEWPVVIGDGYEGMKWDNFNALNTFFYGALYPEYKNGTVSGPNIAYNGHASNAILSSTEPFTLNSAYFTAAYPENIATVELTGYIGGIAGTLVRTVAFNVDGNSPTLVSFNWTGIDTVNFVSVGSTPSLFAMDNLTINAPVPEASTYSMMLAGLGLVGLVARKRQRKEIKIA